MFDFRGYVITICAIFLALGLGLLIGIAYGEDFLVSNQREMIECLERDLARQRDILEEREREISRWENIEPLILAHYNETLSGKEILVLAGEGKRADGIRSLLEEAGATTTALCLPAKACADPVKSVTVFRAVLESLTGPEGPDWRALQAGGILHFGNFPAAPFCCYVIALEGEQSGGDRVLFALWEQMHQKGFRVIAVTPWNDNMDMAGIEPGDYNLVDNVDTFWGRLALLEMIRGGCRGDYGFGLSRIALLPFP